MRFSRPNKGWEALKNGKLPSLDAAEGEAFDELFTGDKTVCNAFLLSPGRQAYCRRDSSGKGHSLDAGQKDRAV
jgi:hypothetical protein